MKALKTYNQYHTDCMIAEGKLKDAERLEERHTGKTELGPGPLVGQRRSSVKKMERLMEKVSMCNGVCVCVCLCMSKRKRKNRSQEVLKLVFTQNRAFPVPVFLSVCV